MENEQVLILNFLKWLDSEENIELCESDLPRSPVDVNDYDKLINKFTKKDDDSMNLELSRVQELEDLSEEYTSILHKVNLFITNNNLDEDEVWDYLTQRYDEDLSYAPEEE